VGRAAFPSSTTGHWLGERPTVLGLQCTFRERSQNPASVPSPATSSALVESQNASSSHDRDAAWSERRRLNEGSPEMPSNDLTLAFSLQALETLARPKQAFEDASTWTSHIGIVSSGPSFVERRRVREAGYQQDFLSGPRSIKEALSRIRNHFETDRYVFVGTDETDGVVEGMSDWTFQSVTDAATAAEWQIGTTSSTDDEWP
jgi:hypothetical protein